MPVPPKDLKTQPQTFGNNTLNCSLIEVWIAMADLDWSVCLCLCGAHCICVMVSAAICVQANEDDMGGRYAVFL